MDNTTRNDALGFSSTSEIGQILRCKASGGHHLCKNEAARDRCYAGLMEVYEHTDSALKRLEEYSD